MITEVQRLKRQISECRAYLESHPGASTVGDKLAKLEAELTEALHDLYRPVAR